MSGPLANLAEFVARDFYAAERAAGLLSTTFQRVEIGQGDFFTAAHLNRLRRDRVRARDFFAREVGNLYSQGIAPNAPELVALARGIAQGKTLGLPAGDEVSLLRRIWREQSLRSVLSPEGRSDSLPSLGWDRYLPICDRAGEAYPAVRTRFVGTPYLAGREPRGVAVLIPGLEGVVEKYPFVHEFLARAGVTVFQLELPMVHTGLTAPIPFESRFASSSILAQTVVEFFREVRVIMGLHPELQDQALSVYAISQGAYHLLEAMVVLEKDLGIDGAMYLDAPRIRMGDHYRNPKIWLATQLGRLLVHYPRLVAKIHFPKGPPLIDQGTPEAVAAWNRRLYENGVSIGAYHPFLFDLGLRERVLQQRLLWEDGHKRLPDRLRVDYCPGDERVNPYDSRGLVDLRKEDAGRPRAIETIKMQHGGTHKNPEASVPPLVEFFTRRRSPSLRELGLEGRGI